MNSEFLPPKSPLATLLRSKPEEKKIEHKEHSHHNIISHLLSRQQFIYLVESTTFGFFKQTFAMINLSYAYKFMKTKSKKDVLRIR